MQTIVVTDDPDSWLFLRNHATIVHAAEYLTSSNYQQQTHPLRVINLCQAYAHQSIGYYVSLLAHARDHKIFPSVDSIQDVLNPSLSKFISKDIDDEIQHSLAAIKGGEFIFSIYFGQNIAKSHGDLARKLHGLFPVPMLRFTLEKRKQWCIKHLQILSKKDILPHHLNFLEQAAENFLLKKRVHQWRKKQRYHDLAILVDANESNAPSNKNDSKSIAEYDALFIRATTAVNHYTYRLSRIASQENLVVIDDPQSIIKCSNKVYLAELLRNHQIITPETTFISKYDKNISDKIQFPCILKKPDSAFSQGVIKVDNHKDLQRSLVQFFKTSELVLVQPFIPTEYDWRVGILDNKPLFVCRYYMAQNHWQIYNWEAKKEKIMGASETVSLTDVPEILIKIALKSTRLIGDGLYGVDIKYWDNKYYVIEINDNPNIDHEVEDLILGDRLYEQIMSVFLQRIRKKHGYVF